MGEKYPKAAFCFSKLLNEWELLAKAVPRWMGAGAREVKSGMHFTYMKPVWLNAAGIKEEASQLGGALETHGTE